MDSPIHKIHGALYALSHRHISRFIIWASIAALSASLLLVITSGASSADIDNVAVTLGDESMSAENQVTVTFTPTTTLAAGNIRIYLGENTGGAPFTDGDADQTGADISCTQSGTTFQNGAQTDATATTPMNYYIEVNTGGNTNAVSCTLGSGAADGPNNPTAAGSYSVAVVTDNDTGAGIAYVGNANAVTVSGQVLANLTILLNNADGTACTATGSVVSCNLGIFTVAAVNTGNYDINVGTNAASGATVRVGEDGNFRNGLLTISDVLENGTVSAGSEEYGIAVTADAAWTEQGDFSDDDTPIATGPDSVATTGGPIDLAGDDITVTHKAAINSTTEAATYAHTVTWTAVANF